MLREKVLAWCNQNFNLKEFTIKEIPLFPGGVLLTDKAGDQILVYYDIQYEHIQYEIIEREDSKINF